MEPIGTLTGFLLALKPRLVWATMHAKAEGCCKKQEAQAVRPGKTLLPETLVLNRTLSVKLFAQIRFSDKDATPEPCGTKQDPVRLAPGPNPFIGSAPSSNR